MKGKETFRKHADIKREEKFDLEANNRYEGGKKICKEDII